MSLFHGKPSLLEIAIIWLGMHENLIFMAWDELCRWEGCGLGFITHAGGKFFYNGAMF